MKSDDPAILHIAPSDPAYADPRIAASERRFPCPQQRYGVPSKWDRRQKE